MAIEDKEKTSFITNQGIYYYNLMPFGIKNAKVTRQRLVNNVFANKIGHNIEAYGDDIMVKSKKVREHVKNLDEFWGTKEVQSQA